MSEIPLGRFIWYELLTDDPAGAQPFYKEVVGWGTSEWGDGPEPYTMWMNGETPVGGVMQLSEEAKAMGAPPHWLAYVATPDVDDLVYGTFDRLLDIGVFRVARVAHRGRHVGGRDIEDVDAIDPGQVRKIVDRAEVLN